MKRNHICFWAFILLLSSSFAGYSQTKIATFYHTAEDPLQAQNKPIPADSKVKGISTAILSRGSGVKYANNSTYSYVATFSQGESKEQAYTNGSYFQFSVTAEEGKSLKMSSLNARLRTASELSVTKYRWKYSVDNTIENSFKEIGDADQNIGFTHTQGEDVKTDLSNIAELQSIAPGKTVYFRLYAWGAKGSHSKAGFGFGKSNVAKREVLALVGEVKSK